MARVAILARDRSGRSDHADLVKLGALGHVAVDRLVRPDGAVAIGAFTVSTAASSRGESGVRQFENGGFHGAASKVLDKDHWTGLRWDVKRATQMEQGLASVQPWFVHASCAAHFEQIPPRPQVASPHLLNLARHRHLELDGVWMERDFPHTEQLPGFTEHHPVRQCGYRPEGGR